MNSNGAENRTVDAVVIGGGPAGLTAAIALSDAGVETALVARPAPPDSRTTALLASSVKALETLGVWSRCRAHSAPLEVVRIVDDRPGLLRAPEVAFGASEIGLEAFGHNIENRHLTVALEGRAGELASLTRIAAGAERIAVADERVTVHLGDGGRVSGRIAIGADGRRSLARAAAGIATDGQSYPQTALALNLTHARPHRNVATEFHTRTGPFTLVPLPGSRSSLVWVVEPPEAAALVTQDEAALAAEIERRSHSILGKISVEGGRGAGAFPLAIETARAFAGNRIALIGEAAHVMPPIGAQGLNLGLRDAATIAELVVDGRRTGADIGSPDLLARYDGMRRIDVASRTMAIDLLNRSLLSDFVPLAGLRGFGLYLLDRVGPLRRALMREGVAPRAGTPRLMRGEQL
jgi:2-octaprenyl-6-methoxyphenol hydroxylase